MGHCSLFQLVTLDWLKERLSYDPLTGLLTWKVRPVLSSSDKTFNKKYAGKTAGSLRPSGYVVVCFHVAGRDLPVKANRIIMSFEMGWLLSEDEIVDHEDRVRSNNKLINLRYCGVGDNSKNVSISKRNTSGFKGVFWHNGAGRWMSQIKSDGKLKYLGLFESKEKAALAYDEAAVLLHGSFASTNTMMGLI